MSAPTIEVVPQDEPGLAVTLKATPPLTGKKYPEHFDWTLDMLERTVFEFRAAGAWDESRIELDRYPATVSCEVLATRGSDAMPWGWKPSDGSPSLKSEPESTKPRWQDQEIRHAIPAFFGNRVLHGLLLFALLGLAIVATTR